MPIHKNSPPYETIRAKSSERFAQKVETSRSSQTPAPDRNKVGTENGVLPSDTGPAPAPKAPETTSTPVGDETTIASTGKKSPSLAYDIRVGYPKAGINEEFDDLTRHYGRSDAIRAYLSRAMDAWVVAYDKGEIGEISSGYPSENQLVFRTNRNVRTDIFEDIKTRIDPMGIRRPSYIASQIFRHAMARYLSRKQHH